MLQVFQSPFVVQRLHNQPPFLRVLNFWHQDLLALSCCQAQDDKRRKQLSPRFYGTGNIPTTQEKCSNIIVNGSGDNWGMEKTYFKASLRNVTSSFPSPSSSVLGFLASSCWYFSSLMSAISIFLQRWKKFEIEDEKERIHEITLKPKIQRYQRRNNTKIHY